MCVHNWAIPLDGIYGLFSPPRGSALGIKGLGWDWVYIAGPGPYSIVNIHVYHLQDKPSACGLALDSRAFSWETNRNVHYEQPFH